MGDCEHTHTFNILKRCVDGHVEVVRVLDIDLFKFLVKLFVFLAFSDDVSILVGWVFQCLQEETHADQLIINKYKPKKTTQSPSDRPPPNKAENNHCKLVWG